MKTFNDNSIMPFGNHKGKHLKDVPADHLIWLYENGRSGRLTEYIKDNLDVLKKVESNRRNPPRKF